MKTLLLTTLTALLLCLGGNLSACPACEAKAKEAAVKKAEAEKKEAAAKAEAKTDKATTNVNVDKASCEGCGTCKKASAAQTVVADTNGKSKGTMKRASAAQVVTADTAGCGGCGCGGCGGGCEGCGSGCGSAKTDKAKDCGGCDSTKAKKEDKTVKN